MSIFKDTVFKVTVFLADAAAVITESLDTHDGGPSRKKASSERPKKQRQDREELLKEIKLAFGILDETPETIQKAEEVVEKAKRFIPTVSINLNPVLQELSKLERALNIFREEAERDMEEEIILMLV